MSRRGLPDWLVIARREFLERVRTKWFLVVTLLGPIVTIAMVVVPALLAHSDFSARIQVVDHTGKLGPALVEKLSGPNWKVEQVPVDTPEATLLGRIKADTIDGYLDVPADVLEKSTSVIYRGDNATNQVVSVLLERAVRAAVQKVRGDQLGIPSDKLESLLSPVDVEAKHTTGEGEGASGGATFLVGYVLAFIIYLSIILYAVNVMRGVVQEKTNRVVEIMVAAAKPRALMFGKLIGVGSVGLLQVGVWVGMAALTMKYRLQLLAFFGASGGFTMPELAPSAIAVILSYFVFGYFFYAAIYAAIGAMVNSDQEAQQAQTPVMLMIMFSFICLQIVTNDPRGSAAEVLTLIPFASPILMPMRFLLGGASLGEVGISLAILLASTWLVAVLAARVYRVGILMYGKRPSLRELVRWIRY